jgi:hypothetical protein
VWAAIDWELTALTLVLLVLLFVAFVVVMRLRRWRQQDVAAAPTPQQQLEQYQEMLDEGLLEKDEFDRLRQALERRNAGAPPDPPT